MNDSDATLQGSTPLLILILTPNTYDIMWKSDAATIDLDKYDSDATRLNTPTNPNT